jgi:glycosyltransferase involved in cell wall biosynthesis
MLVSAIIPNYNHARYLNARIDSILDQAYDAIELIILDDCSTDNSKEVIEQYRAHPKVSHIVLNEHNSGSVFTQWRRGIELAKGELIWIAESDDLCEPVFLAEMTKYFRESSKVVIAFAQSVMFDDNKIVGRTECEFLEEHLDGRSFLEKYMLGTCSIVNASGVLFKKAVFTQISDAFTRYKQCGDWRFWCEIAEHGDVVVSGKYLNYFRRHSTNTTSKNWKEGLYYLEGSEIIKYLIGKHGFTEAVITEQVSKVLRFLEREREIYAKDLYEEIMQQLISIHPKVIQGIQSGLLRQRKKEQIKNIIRKAIK